MSNTDWRKKSANIFTSQDSILFLSTSLKESLLACRLTFTTSNGLTTTASVKPEPSPATQNIWMGREGGGRDGHDLRRENVEIFG